jgi:hypothetical protein
MPRLEFITLVGSIGTVVTAIVALLALWYARGQVREAQKQLKLSQNTAHGNFLLSLDEAFQRHDEIHRRLQPAFEWGADKAGPASREEWFQVASYMGLFERISVMVKHNVLDAATIDQLYGYRMYNIVSNTIIRQAKLEDKEIAVYWREFIGLWLGLKVRHIDKAHGKWDQYPNVTL